MKTYLVTLFTIAILINGLSATSFAQFGDLVNKAKEAAKKKEKKTETKPIDNPKSESSTGKTNQTESNQTKTVDNQIGEIFFSNQPFPAGGEVAGAKTNFTSNEFIYARMVLKSGTIGSVLKPVVDERTKMKMVEFKMYRIVERGGSSSINEIGRNNAAVIKDSDLDKSYLDFDVFPSPEKATSMFSWGGNPNDGLLYAADIYLFLNKSDTAEGNHKIWTEFTIKSVDFRGNELSRDDWKKVTSSFNFTFRGADFATIKANQDKLEKTFFDNYRRQKNANEPLPAEWSAKSNPIIGGYTTASVSSLFLKSFSDGNVLKIVKLYVAPPKGQGMWIVQNNNYGIPNYRYSTQWFTAFVSRTDNGNCFYQGFGLRQNYAGAGTYGNTIIDHGDSSVITCDKLGLK